MRDAFGGAFMIKVFIVFTIIYIFFTAMAVNYAKAFKVKNMMIEYLESGEIVDLRNLTAEEELKMQKFIDEEIMGNMHYYVDGICPTDEEATETTYCSKAGVKIVRSGSAENTEGIYYTVSTYIGWSIPFINMLLALDNDPSSGDVAKGIWEISGQTRLIVNKR